jgi:hypothetical protein
MRLKDKLRVYQEAIPSVAIPVTVEIGDDVLELKVSRRDVSIALDREIRESLRQDPDFDPEDEEQFDLPQLDAMAKRVVAAIHAYRIYPKDAPAEVVDREEWIEGIEETELKELGSPYFWTIVNSVWAALNPNLQAGEEGASSSSPATA